MPLLEHGAPNAGGTLDSGGKRAKMTLPHAFWHGRGRHPCRRSAKTGATTKERFCRSILLPGVWTDSEKVGSFTRRLATKMRCPEKGGPTIIIF